MEWVDVGVGRCGRGVVGVVWVIDLLLEWEGCSLYILQ